MMFIQKYLSGGLVYARQTGYICACAIIFGLFVMLFRRTGAPHHGGTQAQERLYGKLQKILCKQTGFERGRRGTVMSKRRRTKSERTRFPRKADLLHRPARGLRRVDHSAAVYDRHFFQVRSGIAAAPGYPFSRTSWSEWTIEHYYGFIVREGKIDNMPIWMLNSLWSTLATVGLTVLVDLLTAYAVVFLRVQGQGDVHEVPAPVDGGAFRHRYRAPRLRCTPPSATPSTSRATRKRTFTFISGSFFPASRGSSICFSCATFSIPSPRTSSTAQRATVLEQFCHFQAVWSARLAKSTIMPAHHSVHVYGQLEQPPLAAACFLRAGIRIGTPSRSPSRVIRAVRHGARQRRCPWQQASLPLIPIFVVFVITQNKMIDGLATTGVKG